MAIGVDNFFAPMTFEQANPQFANSDAVNKMINNIVQSQYAQPNAQANLQKQLLANQISQAQAQYAPQMNAAQVADLQAAPNLKNAQAYYYNQEAAYTPEKYALQAQMMQYRNQRFGQAFQFKQLLSQLPPSAKAAYIAQNPEAYSNMLDVYGNSALTTTPNMPGNTLQTTQNAPVNLGNQTGNPGKIMGNFGNQRPNIAQVLQNMPNNTGQFPASNNNSIFASTPNSINQLSNASKMQANQDLTTNSMRNRYQNGISAANLLNSDEVANQFNTLAKYSGVEGAAKAQLLRLTNPEEWAAYQSAKIQLPTMLSGSIKQLEGLPTSDVGLKTALSAFEMAQQMLPTNPQAAINYFNTGKRLLAQEAKSLQTAANPIFKINRLPQDIPIQNNNVLRGTSNNTVRVISPNGQAGSIPINNLDRALARGYRRA